MFLHGKILRHSNKQENLKMSLKQQISCWVKTKCKKQTAHGSWNEKLN